MKDTAIHSPSCWMITIESSFMLDRLNWPDPHKLLGFDKPLPIFTFIVVIYNIFVTISNYLKRFLVVQNFSKALKFEFISFNMSNLEKGC